MDVAAEGAHAADVAGFGEDFAFEIEHAFGDGSILAGDYHSGTLSVIIPFGAAGAFGFLWLLWAGINLLYNNYRHGDEALAGAGGFLVILTKEEYLFLAVPICLALVLASASRDRGPGWRRFRAPQTEAAIAVAVVLGLSAAAYQVANTHSSYGKRTQPMRAVDTIFEHIVSRNDPTKATDLRALGLPVSWAKYAGSYYWSRTSVRNDPLYQRYEPKLTDAHMARYFLTHPGHILSVGQQAAREGLRVRVTTLGDYPPSAGHLPGPRRRHAGLRPGARPGLGVPGPRRRRRRLPDDEHRRHDGRPARGGGRAPGPVDGAVEHRVPGHPAGRQSRRRGSGASRRKLATPRRFQSSRSSVSEAEQRGVTCSSRRRSGSSAP